MCCNGYGVNVEEEKKIEFIFLIILINDICILFKNVILENIIYFIYIVEYSEMKFYSKDLNIIWSFVIDWFL